MAQMRTPRQSHIEPPSWPFDFSRQSDSPKLSDRLDGLLKELEGHEKRDRPRKAEEAGKFRDAVSCLILNLFAAWKASPDLTIGFHRGKSYYTNQNRYRPSYVGWSSFDAAFKTLEAAGYLNVVKHGSYDRSTNQGSVTRIAATESLIQLITEDINLSLTDINSRTRESEGIILKDRNKSIINYEDTDETNLMRTNLRMINDKLQRHWIDIEITDEEFDVIRKQIRLKHNSDSNEHPAIDLTKRTLVRIFNNENWLEGGRFYRGWWQSVPSRYRGLIRIDGKQTTEIDYSSIHPVLLYAEADKELEGDAYDISIPHAKRSLIKKTFNALLNAKGKINVPSEFKADEIGMTWEEFQDAVVARHAPVKHLFRTGYGLRLQRIDSDIAERVMLRFLQMNYPCLPVHDSFIVHHALADELEKIMSSEFRFKTGIDIGTKTAIGEEVVQERGYVDDDVVAILDANGEYSGYNRRLQDWWRVPH